MVRVSTPHKEKRSKMIKTIRKLIKFSDFVQSPLTSVQTLIVGLTDNCGLKVKAKVGLLNKSNLRFLNGIIKMSMMHFIHICKMLFMYQLQPIQYATKSL